MNDRMNVKDFHQVQYLNHRNHAHMIERYSQSWKNNNKKETI